MREDKEYKPKVHVKQSRMTPARTRQQESVDYSECKQDSESETVTSEGTLEGERELGEDNDLDIEQLWTLGTLTSRLTEVGQQDKSLSEQTRQTDSMAQKSEQSSMEKMMEMFLQMRQEEQTREARREQDRLEEKIGGSERSKSGKREGRKGKFNC